MQACQRKQQAFSLTCTFLHIMGTCPSHDPPLTHTYCYLFSLSCVIGPCVLWLLFSVEPSGAAVAQSAQKISPVSSIETPRTHTHTFFPHGFPPHRQSNRTPLLNNSVKTHTSFYLSSLFPLSLFHLLSFSMSSYLLSLFPLHLPIFFL